MTGTTGAPVAAAGTFLRSHNNILYHGLLKNTGSHSGEGVLSAEVL